MVTSETGAVIHDIIDVTRRRNSMIDIVLYPAKVQGIGAENTVVNGIKALEQTDVDVIIVARGGGSLEDLSPFNTEQVAWAIYDAQKPVISAVGHETDFTIADFVADVRAPTPSAAAELISSDLSNFFLILTNSFNRLNRFVNDYLSNIYFDLDTKYNYIKKNADKKLLESEKSLQMLSSKYYRLSLEKFNEVNTRFEKLASSLEANNPINILRKGYAKATFNNKALKSSAEVKVGDEIEIQLSKGKLNCEVKSKTEE